MDQSRNNSSDSDSEFFEIEDIVDSSSDSDYNPDEEEHHHQRNRRCRRNGRNRFDGNDGPDFPNLLKERIYKAFEDVLAKHMRHRMDHFHQTTGLPDRRHHRVQRGERGINYRRDHGLSSGHHHRHHHHKIHPGPGRHSEGHHHRQDFVHKRRFKGDFGRQSTRRNVSERPEERQPNRPRPYHGCCRKGICC